MRRYITSILPTPAQWLSLLILPFVLGIYFLITKYSDQFISTQGIDYITIQDNVLATLYISGTLAQWFTRFMDFAFWGVLATIAILIWWSASVARTSVQNHLTEQTFTNFKKTSSSWHGNFTVVVAIKAVLVFVIIYSLVSLIAKAIPTLALGVAQCVQALTWPHVQTVVWGVGLMILFQALLVSSVKLFKITKAD